MARLHCDLKVKDFDPTKYTIVINTDQHGRIQAVSDSIAGCVDAWEMYRDDPRTGGCGASNMRRGCGDVYRGPSKIARVSYNGRCWDMQDNEILFGDQ